MKKDLYLEAKSGISGDMTVAALLDLGANAEKMTAAINSLNIDGLHVHVSDVVKSGIRAKDFDVHYHDHPHEHHHEHSHDHDHSHEHRNFADICAVIDQGMMTDRAKQLAKKIFQIVANAESKVHGKPVEEIHFHEVGAWDSIADIVAAAVCFDDLDISEVYVSPLYEGSGFVTCAHGKLPVPVPATAEIAATNALDLRLTDVPFELVTPTGAAIAAALRTKTGLPNGKMIKTGYGAGKRETENPNVLRAFLIESEKPSDNIWVLESNIDDSTGEQLGFAMEKLFENGARDVHYMPCFMKKNRPGWLLRIICTADKISVLEKTVFETTTTIGLRKFPVDRTGMKREKTTVETPFGTVEIKKCSFGDLTRFYPEYESVKAVCETSGQTFSTVFEAAQKAAENK